MEGAARWGEPYEASAARIELLCADASSWAVTVPACPGWVVADVLAHLTGPAQDWVRERLDGTDRGGHPATPSVCSRSASSEGLGVESPTR